MTDQDNHWRWATPESVFGGGDLAGQGEVEVGGASAMDARIGSGLGVGSGSSAGFRLSSGSPAASGSVSDPGSGRPGGPESGFGSESESASGLGSGSEAGSRHGADGVRSGGVTGGRGAVVGGPSRLDRWREAFAERLPATLRGRWSLDRTTAIVLVVSVLLAALVLGGWTWLRGRPHELSVARTHPAAQGTDGRGNGLSPQLSGQGSAGPLPGLPPPRAAPLQPGQQPPVPFPGPLPQADASPWSGAGPGLAGPAAGPGGPSVVVDVEGKVARPGVKTLPEGSRVIDAIAAAGGAQPGTDLTGLNQAQVLVDGQQILVGIGPPPNPGGPQQGKPGGKARGRGSPATPVRLNEATLADLEQLPGIGPALAQRILDYRAQHGPFRSVGELRQVSGFGGARFQAIEPMLTL